jgi:hypothetical protein
MKNFTKYLIVALTTLLVFGTWWATKSGWSLTRLQAMRGNTIQNCPTWQRDVFGNCPPKTLRLSLGSREYQDNKGK